MAHTDPRVAALYDTDNPDGPDHEHYRQRADSIDPTTIVDLGCGTGILTVTLTKAGRTVLGIDPDKGMLDVALQRHQTESVTWTLGDSRDIEPACADLVLMTGNVAQHIQPSEWKRTLDDIATGLRHGGILTFETRNPSARAWEDWQADNLRHTRNTSSGSLTEWMEVTDPDDDGTVVLTAHNLFADTGEDVTVVQPLTFRTLQQIEGDLMAAGLSITNTWGGWNHEPFDDSSLLIVIEATKQ